MKKKYFLMIVFIVFLVLPCNAYAVPMTFIEFNFDKNTPDSINRFVFVTPDSVVAFNGFNTNTKGFFAYDAVISFSTFDRNRDNLTDSVYFSADGTFDSMNRFGNVKFSTYKMSGVNLEPGFYPNAQRTPFEDSGHPGLDEGFSGSGLNIINGSFLIKEAIFLNNSNPTFGLFSNVESFAATYDIGDNISGTVFYNFDPEFPSNFPKSPTSPTAPNAPKSPKLPKAPNSPNSLFAPTAPDSPFAPNAPSGYLAQIEDSNVPTTVNPEPATLLLFGTGIVGAMFRRRKQV